MAGKIKDVSLSTPESRLAYAKSQAGNGHLGKNVGWPAQARPRRVKDARPSSNLDCRVSFS
jgi:hypothetical protein